MLLDDSCCDTPLHVSRTNPVYERRARSAYPEDRRGAAQAHCGAVGGLTLTLAAGAGAHRSDAGAPVPPEDRAPSPLATPVETHAPRGFFFLHQCPLVHVTSPTPDGGCPLKSLPMQRECPEMQRLRLEQWVESPKTCTQG